MSKKYITLKYRLIVLDMGRSVIALFMIGFLAIFSAFWTGVVGCWRRSPGNITATAILMLFACQYIFRNKISKIFYIHKEKNIIGTYIFLNDVGLLSAGGMGLWHGVEYYEKEKIVGEEYYQQWSNVSVLNFIYIIIFYRYIKYMLNKFIKVRLRFIVDLLLKQKIATNNIIY